ncbi:MAG: hypothetical protein KBC16_01205 [Candidatus Pacebacteria bacterium]|nr:hypothetical protein [Candidatus Paceibacterota bacterium]
MKKRKSGWKKHRDAVVHACHEFGMRPKQLFCLAYSAWRRKFDGRVVSHAFNTWLKKQRVPYWVRDFIRMRRRELAFA